MPKLQLTLNGTELNKAIALQVTRRENGIDAATIDFADTAAAHWIADFDVGDPVLIQVKDETDLSWTTLLRGRIAPAADAKTPAEIMHLKCEGNGWPLAYMMVANEYGSQVSTSYDTIGEIVTDIINEYVEDTFRGGAATGHNFDLEIDSATLTETARYMSFPYVPAYKAINEALEIFQGVRGANAGAHWVVDTSATPKLYVQRIFAHSAQAVADGWTSNYNIVGADGGAGFRQRQDFTTFSFPKQTKEANYVLYYGAWRHPCPVDKFTENNASEWAGVKLVAGTAATINNDGTTKTYGDYSIEVVSETGTGSGEGVRAWYPKTYNLSLDITKVRGNYNGAAINMLIYPDSNVDVDGSATNAVPPFVIIGTGNPTAGNWFFKTIPPLHTATWNTVSMPIGPNTGWVNNAAADWTDIDYVGVEFFNEAGTPVLNIDGLHFSGYVNRVVKQAAAYSAGDPCLMKVVTDDYGKDDVIADNDKTGTISKLAYAEYLRSASTPIIGTFTTPLVKDLWPGQVISVYAKEYSTGNYRISDSFRVTEFTHVIGDSGWFTIWKVTNDLLNTHTSPAYNSINRNLAAVRPGTQDMQAASMKMREIDITQPRLVNTY
jgi:hypothetical protein